MGRRYAFVSFLVLLTATSRLAPVAAAEAGSGSRPRYWIWLRNQPQLEILERWDRRAGRDIELAEERLRLIARPFAADSAAELERQRETWAASLRQAREHAFREIERIIGPEQQSVRALVESLGGNVLQQFSWLNLLVVELATDTRELLARHPLVARVDPEPPPVDLGPAVPSSAAGASPRQPSPSASGGKRHLETRQG